MSEDNKTDALKVISEYTVQIKEIASLNHVLISIALTDLSDLSEINDLTLISIDLTLILVDLILILVDLTLISVDLTF